MSGASAHRIQVDLKTAGVFAGVLAEDDAVFQQPSGFALA